MRVLFQRFLPAVYAMILVFLVGCGQAGTPPAPTPERDTQALTAVAPTPTPGPTATPTPAPAVFVPLPTPTPWADPCPDDALYARPDGRPEAGDGSLEAPFHTLKEATGQAGPGTTICVLGGVYTAVKDTITARGTAEEPVTIRPAQNESVVFDGTGADIGELDSIIFIGHAGHVIFEGFEIRNSTGRGISFYESDHITIRHNRVHGIHTRGIGGGGDHIIIESNEVWNSVLENENNAYNAVGGWAAGISTWTREDGSPSTNITIRNNYVHDVWGEGIMALRADGYLVEDNVVHDAYSVNLYINKVQNGVFRNNYLYTTTDKYNRSDRTYPAHGINIANEFGNEGLPHSSHLVIANNLIVGTGHGIRYWHDTRGDYLGNRYNDIQIVNNVVMDTYREAIFFDEVAEGYARPENVTLHNNIIFAGRNGKALYIGDRSAWTISHNNWPDGIPEPALEPNSLAEPPQFVNPHLGGPPEGFQLQAGSTSIGAGLTVPDVATDFHGLTRGNAPSLGLFEIQ